MIKIPKIPTSRLNNAQIFPAKIKHPQHQEHKLPKVVVWWGIYDDLWKRRKAGLVQADNWITHSDKNRSTQISSYCFNSGFMNLSFLNEALFFYFFSRSESFRKVTAYSLIFGF